MGPVILSDYNLPGFSGLVALDLLKARRRRHAVHPAVGRDRRGRRRGGHATAPPDHLLKNNMARLVPAMERSRRTGAARRRRRRELQSRQRLRELAQHLQTSVGASARRSRARSTTTWAVADGAELRPRVDRRHTTEPVVRPSPDGAGDAVAWPSRPASA